MSILSTASLVPKTRQSGADPSPEVAPTTVMAPAKY